MAGNMIVVNLMYAKEGDGIEVKERLDDCVDVNLKYIKPLNNLLD